MSGIEATQALQADHPDLVVLILTIFEEEDKILDSIKAGAKGTSSRTRNPIFSWSRS
jgi:DNA-binding NarL/FixJ family response regulator